MVLFLSFKAASLPTPWHLCLHRFYSRQLSTICVIYLTCRFGCWSAMHQQACPCPQVFCLKAVRAMEKGDESVFTAGRLSILHLCPSWRIACLNTVH